MKKKHGTTRRIARALLMLALSPLLLLAIAAVTVMIPPVQKALIKKASTFLYEQTGFEAGIGKIRLRPGPELNLKDVLATYKQTDTILRAGSILAELDLFTKRDSTLNVKAVRISDALFDTHDLIEATRVSGEVGTISIRSDSTRITRGYTRINRLIIKDTEVKVETFGQSPDTTADKPFNWVFDLNGSVIDDVGVTILPEDVRVHVGGAQLSGTAAPGMASYEIKGLRLRKSSVSVGSTSFDFDKLLCYASLDSTYLDVRRLNAESEGARLKFSGEGDINNLDFSGRFEADAEGASVSGTASFNGARNEYGADLDITGLVLNDFIELPEMCEAEGHISAHGRGFDPFSPGTAISLKADLPRCRYGTFRADNVSLDAFLGRDTVRGTIRAAAHFADTSLSAYAQGNIRFELPLVKDMSRPELAAMADMDRVNIRTDGFDFSLPGSVVGFVTKTDSTSCSLVADGLNVETGVRCNISDIGSKMRRAVEAVKDVDDISGIDLLALKGQFPDLDVRISASEHNPFTALLSQKGITFDKLKLHAASSDRDGLSSTGMVSGLLLDTIRIEAIRYDIMQEGPDLKCTASVRHENDSILPGIGAKASATIGKKASAASVNIRSDISEHHPLFPDFSGKLDLTADIEGSRLFEIFSVKGRFDAGGLVLDGNDFGDRGISFSADRTELEKMSLKAQIEDIPASLAEMFIETDMIGLRGLVSGKISALMTKDSLSLDGEIIPSGLALAYYPLNALISLGDKPVIFRDDKLLFEDIPIYGVERSSVLLNGVCDIGASNMDLTITGKRFRPLELARCDSIPLFGLLYSDVDARISGPFDSLSVKAGLNILPETDLTYYLDRKNFIKISAGGPLVFDFPAGKDPRLDGGLTINDGEVHYTLPYYPLSPFKINKGSSVRFAGDPGNPILDITAMQPAKATVGNGLDSRTVNFNVGLKIANALDKLSLDFLIEAPDDAEVQSEIGQFDKDERNRVAAALLATGMYVSSNNIAAMNSSYALTSMLQSRLNALSNNRLNKFVDVDFGVGEVNRAGITSMDYSLNLSKTFFADRLKLSVGGHISDNRNSNNRSGKVSSFIDNASVEWKLKKDGLSSVRLFHSNDYENVIDGELQKDGLGVTLVKNWARKDDNGLDKSFSLSLDGNFSLRSNHQFGPDLSLTYSKRNLFKHGETLSAKLRGAFYVPTEKGKADSLFNNTYQLGGEVALAFPCIIFPGLTGKSPGYPATSRFSAGYMTENVANGYRHNKFQLGATYLLHPSPFVTHSITPLSLSLVNTTSISERYLETILKHPELFNELLKDEYIPSIQYGFNFNNTADKSKAVTTNFSADIKESGNIISGIQTLAGKDFKTRDKNFIFKRYNQFVRFNLELRNNFRLGERIGFATRILGGAVFPYGNSEYSPFSEMFFCGGPNSIRAFSARSIGPGGYHNTEYDAQAFHRGDIRLEMNAELRFPLFWKFEGAVFLDAGNIWSLESSSDTFKTEDEISSYKKDYKTDYVYDGKLRWSTLFQTMALGTGFGLRFKFDPVIIRIDTGVALHCPYPTSREGYYNIPRFWKDGVCVNFAIGYPF